jgi:pimeloyl-ACP methyl ester carboxylesterase
MPILLALLAPIALVLAPVVLLLAWSRGTPKPFLDACGDPLPGSLAEKARVRINGVDQGVFLRSRDVANPVLLFVHGGPGMPEYWLTQRYPTGLEERFTVAWWEQRGAGLSYHPDIPPGTMTLEQFVEDTLAVAGELYHRFDPQRVYQMGHSWGSYVAIQAAAREPSRFHAYIGVSQITHQVRSERLAYAYMLERYREQGDERMVRRLEAAPVTTDAVPLPPAYDALRDEAMHRLGVGTTRAMRSVVSGLFLPSWAFREYTLREKVNLWRGKRFSRSTGLWDRMQATDLAEDVTELAIPAYFLHGAHDFTVSYPMAKAYARRLAAPRVGFYTFEQSAHSPMFEEPARTLRILTEDVLGGGTALADP